MQVGAVTFQSLVCTWRRNILEVELYQGFRKVRSKRECIIYPSLPRDIYTAALNIAGDRLALPHIMDSGLAEVGQYRAWFVVGICELKSPSAISDNFCKPFSPVIVNQLLQTLVSCLQSTCNPFLQSPAGSPDFCKWESCRTMPLVGGYFSVISSHLPPFQKFRRRSIFTSIILIGSQDLAVKNRPNFFTHPYTNFQFMVGLADYSDAVIQTNVVSFDRAYHYDAIMTLGCHCACARFRVGDRGDLWNFRRQRVFPGGTPRDADTTLECKSSKQNLHGCAVFIRLVFNTTSQHQYPTGSHRIFVCGTLAGRCRWSAGFLGDLPPFNSGAVPYTPQ
ncbi:hypothetical protein PR048_030355 [Dryococelus australis]|uniref:Uncharacterized protein n=1 Tax=Dryococelus australis TaxID=614101 RepID=A0ABQ9GCN5_9NEOP|nr:hypothetical protein PR048_030355 [Dryococelus australis]